jgi:hypothetical protein
MSATALAAQAPARDQQTLLPPSGTGAIAGVVREPDGVPVRRARVTVSGDMRLDRSALTDEEGRFSFSDLPSGRFTVTAEKPGYPRMSHGATRPFRSGAGIFLKDGESLTEVAITLARGAVLTGTVYDQHGEPMPGIGIMAWEIRTSLSGERTLDMPATGGEWVNTDERGVYRIYGLPPGQYTLGTYWAFHGQGFDVRTLTPAEINAAFSTIPSGPPPSAVPADTARYNFSPVFTPGVTDPLSAATYTLGPGDERNGVDLRMQFVPMGSVEVIVSGTDGSPAPAGTRTTLTRRGPVSALNTSQVSGTNAGVYRSSSLGPTEYTFLAQVRATATSPALWAREDFSLAPGQPLKLAVTLQPALAVSATARFASSAAAPPKDLSRLLFGLRSVGGGPGAETETVVSASGQATITGVIPGRYTLAPSVPPGIAGGVIWTVATVSVSGQDVTDKAFDITAGGIGPIDVTFTDQVTDLSGTITSPSGGPATDYFVIAIPADRDYWLPFSRRIISTRPDGAGRYLFRGLTPGEYRIALTTDLIPRDLQDVAALERLAAQSAPFTLAAGAKQTLDLKAGRRP